MEVVIKIGELGVLDAVSDEWIEWYGLEHQEKFTLLEKIEFIKVVEVQFCCLLQEQEEQFILLI